MKLTHDNYYSPEAAQEFMSASQYKDFMRCEALALARIRGEIPEKKTTALLVGGYVDAYFSDRIKQYREEYPEIFKRDGDLKSDFILAEQIIARIERDEFLMSIICKAEKQIIVTGGIEGVPFKGMIDFLLPDMIVDMKIMANFADIYDEEYGCRVEWWRYYGYDLQAAIYRHLEGGDKPFGIVAATKEKEPGIDIDAFLIPESAMHNRLVEVENLAPKFQAIKQGLLAPRPCGKCPYCRDKKELSEFREVEIC